MPRGGRAVVYRRSGGVGRGGSAPSFLPPGVVPATLHGLEVVVDLAAGVEPGGGVDAVDAAHADKKVSAVESVLKSVRQFCLGRNA